MWIVNWEFKKEIKKIEIRLNDEKRQQIKIGDTIKFLKGNNC